MVMSIVILFVLYCTDIILTNLHIILNENQRLFSTRINDISKAQVLLFLYQVTGPLCDL